MRTTIQPKPVGDRVFYLQQFEMGGKTKSGILVQHDQRIPPIFGRVTAVADSCRDVRVGDWVVYLPKRPTRVSWTGGRVYVLDELNILGIVDPGDQTPWFEGVERA